jgi:phosphosulfolactate synthase
MVTGLNLPVREVKPRQKGLTLLIDNGAPLNLFIDTMQSACEYIDFVKFGWGTSLVTKFLDKKIAVLRELDIHYFFGGTLFEKYLSEDKVNSYMEFCKKNDCRYVEISNGTYPISNTEKSQFIEQFSREFIVFSEVGNKDPSISTEQDASMWLSSIKEDLNAGASKVITEARESGTSGLFLDGGNIRMDIFEEIKHAGIPFDKLIFEAPKKKMQTFFIQNVGSNVNLANIALSDVISVETLRLGLRSDTFEISAQ